ncbi:MAG: DUF2225 domain-containing protein [Planctomycetota bacterium]|jgi:hypothetical protein
MRYDPRRRPGTLGSVRTLLVVASTLAALGTVSVNGQARAGIRPPGKDAPTEWDGTGEGFFRRRPLDKPYTGALAKCPICNNPYKDHLDGNVCRDPTRPGASLDKLKARCPVCSREFEAAVPEPGRTGEMDRDFCRHPRGTVALATELWFCTRCGYSALHRDFGRPVHERIKQLVRKKISPVTKAQIARHTGLKPKSFKFEDFGFLPQESIPEHLKYENAVAIYQKSGAGHRTMASLHLGASHAYRRLVNKPFSEGGLDRAIRRVEAMLTDPLAAGERDATGLVRRAKKILRRADSKDAYASERLGRRERFYLFIRLAGLHDRLGEGWYSRPFVAEAAGLAQGEKDEPKRQAYMEIVKGVAGLLDREVHHQKLAAGELKPALASRDIPETERLTSVYLLGELFLRTGSAEKALPWFEAAQRLAEGARRAASGSAGAATRRDRDAAEATRLAAWSHERLRSPVFYEAEEGGAPKRIASDPAEKDFINKAILSTSEGAPAKAQPGEGRTAQAPAAEAEPPAPPIEPRAKPDVPKSCREQMLRIWGAIDAYRKARGAFPPDLAALVRADLVSRSSAGAFECVESGSDLFYRRPPAGSGKAFILFHNSPSRCPCKNMLWSDGSITQFGR